MTKTSDINILIVILISVFILSNFYMPNSFETDGGSCYRGITAFIIRFFLTVCGTLSLGSLIAGKYSKIKPAKVLSILSFIIWFLFSLTFITVSFKYFLPFSLISLIIIFQNFKKQKVEKDLDQKNTRKDEESDYNLS